MNPHATSTFSILACDPESGRIGAATASCVLGIGGRALFHRSSGVVVVMQHIEYPPIAERVMAEILTGRHPQEATEGVLRSDPESRQRQMLAGDCAGRFGLWNGGLCSPIVASVVGKTAIAAGNCLSADTVPQRVLEAYEKGEGQPLSIRLLAALARAAELKADERGLQSAAMISIPRQIHGWESQIVDLRADFHEDPVGELARLYGVFKHRFGPQ